MSVQFLILNFEFLIGIHFSATADKGKSLFPNDIEAFHSSSRALEFKIQNSKFKIYSWLHQ